MCLFIGLFNFDFNSIILFQSFAILNLAILLLYLFILHIPFQEIIDEGGDKFSVVPNTQFWVARTANKDNSSYYEVDG